MMIVQIAIAAVTAAIMVAIGASLISADRRKAREGRLSNFLLASGGLRRIPILSLLLSSSFGLNTFFYQGWLGYTVGYWGFIIQLAWAASFWLLIPYAAKIRNSKSLHDFLSHSYGPEARVVAAALSIIGFLFLMSWEVDICRDMFSGFFTNPKAHVPNPESTAAWLAGLTAIGALIYSIYGGLRGNALADIIQNLIKFGVLALILSLLFSHPRADFWNGLLAPWSKVSTNLGIVGLVTNMLFSVCFQFVDASMWQSVQSSAKAQTEDETKRNLRETGVAVFIAPGIIGTLLGVALVSYPDVTQQNILYTAINVAGAGPMLTFLFFFAAASAVMSLVDGLLIASAYALVIDFLHPKSTLSELDRDDRRSLGLLAWVRLALIGFSFAAAWGVHEFVGLFGLTTFDTVYLVVIPQLAMLGPILMALFSRSPIASGRRSYGAITVMLLSLALGVAFNYAPKWGGSADLPNWAGTITIGLSLILSVPLLNKRGQDA